MSLRTIFNAYAGMQRREARAIRNAWEQTRWSTWLLVNIQLEKKHRIKKPEDLVRFDWEKKNAPPIPSAEERKKLFAKDDAWVKRFHKKFERQLLKHGTS